MSNREGARCSRTELFRSVLLGGDGPTVTEQVSARWFDLAGTPFPRQVPALTALVGTERLPYGSDHSWTPAAVVVAKDSSLDAVAPPENDEWRALTTRNAGRLPTRRIGPD